MVEQVLFREGGVTVTDRRLVVPSQTYAISGITSVRSTRRRPSRTGPAVLAALAVAALLLEGLAMALSAVFITGAAVWWFLGMPSYVLHLKSASGESEAHASRDGAFIDRVAGAVEKAIAAREGGAAKEPISTLESKPG